MKKFLLTGLVFIMVSSFAFAGGQSGGAGPAKQTWETVKLNQSDQPWLVPYDTPVTLVTADDEYIGVNWEFPGDTESNNTWTRLYRKFLNIDIQTKWVSSDYYTTLNLDIASGDLPDAFKVNNTQFSQLLEAGAIDDVTNAFNNTLSSRLQGEYDAVPGVLQPYTRNGRLPCP
ncbi:MAG: extracellular solute-binding protein [Treponema sp.]|jgi:putative aldouronate transport system substrate-binding protein|nr:extracellular solute-binding protein [Treponema sp.]